MEAFSQVSVHTGIEHRSITCKRRDSNRAETPGSHSLSHRALGSIHSAEIGPAPSQWTASAGSPRPSARILDACAALRESIHSRAGRSGAPSASQASTVQLVVARQIATHSSGAQPALAIAALTDVPRPLHQSAGCCSAQPVAG
eukprot:436503-Prymnesium_polylepis.1